MRRRSVGVKGVAVGSVDDDDAEGRNREDRGAAAAYLSGWAVELLLESAGVAPPELAQCNSTRP